MLGRNGSKFLFVAGALVLVIVLYVAPKKSMKQKTPVTGNTFDMNDMVLFQENTLSQPEKEQVSVWKDSIRNGSYGYYDSLAGLWDQRGIYTLSAWFYDEKAEADGDEQSYLQAAYRYFDAYKQAVDTSLRDAMVESAIRCYNKVLELNPSNDNAKTDLGILYAEATPQPMKGIMLLREVVDRNPQHEHAQLNLGILSVKSGQLEKAVQRFRTVLDINPARSEVRLMLARTYLELGIKDSAAMELEAYKASQKDPARVEEADRILETIQ